MKTPIWDFSHHPSVPIGDTDLAAHYILGGVYGLRGIKVTVSPTSPAARCGGLESSNAIIYALHWAGSVLAGTGHDQAELFSRAVLDADYALGDCTGGQGMSAMIHGGYHTFRYVVGAGMLGYIANELVPSAGYQNIGEAIALVQPGYDYKSPPQRRAAQINDLWCGANTVAEGHALQSRISRLALEFAQGIHAYAVKDDAAGLVAAIAAANAQVDIRSTLAPDYLLGNEEFVRQVREMSGCAFALGAGGPGAMFGVIVPKGRLGELIQRFGLVEINDANATAIQERREILKGFFPYKINPTGMHWSNDWETAGFGPIPKKPVEIEV